MSPTTVRWAYEPIRFVRRASEPVAIRAAVAGARFTQIAPTATLRANKATATGTRNRRARRPIVQSRRHQIWPLLAITGLLSLSLAGCGNISTKAGEDGKRSAQSAGDDIPRVQTVTVEQQDLARKIELPGTVEGFETVDLYAKVGGFLEQISADIGDRVIKGQVLAQLSIPEMEKELLQKQAATAAAHAEVAQAEAAIEQAESQVASAVASVEEARSDLQEKQAQVDFRQVEHDRIKGLVGRGSLNKELLEEVTYKLKAAMAALNAVGARIRSAEADLAAKKTDVNKAVIDRQTALARVDLAKADYQRVEALSHYAVIKAPFDGVVTKRMVDPGAFIQPAEGNSAAKPLLTVSRTDLVRISLQLPMAEVRWLDRGDRAVLDRINVLPGERFEGTVTRFSTALNHDSRMMRVEIDLENPDHRLMPGYYGYVTLYLAELSGQSVIPSSALLTQDNESYVLVVNQGVCQKRVVKTSYKDGTIVGIESGVEPGEQVIQAGGGLLVDGQKVIVGK